MPIVLDGQKLYCAISGKVIRNEDYVVLIPAFQVDPEDPDSIFSDNIALRDEFEKWVLKERIIAKAQEPWLQESRSRKSHAVLVDNEYFFITRSLVEERVSLNFMKHVFGIGTSTELWLIFCQQITTLDKNTFQLSPSVTLTWEMVFHSHIILTREIKNGSKDRINISTKEWSLLKEILSDDSVA